MHWKLKYLVVALGIFLLISVYDPVRSLLFPSGTGFKIEEFAGGYHLGEGVGILSLMNFNENWTFEMHLITNTASWQTAHGELSEDADRIYLTYNVEDIGIEYVIPVIWGERRYLVPYFAEEDVNAIETFCNRVASGEEPRNERQGWVYLQNGHWDWPADGLPKTAWGAELCGGSTGL